MPTKMANNKTGLKSFDRLAADGRVSEIRREGDDGYWVDLAPGWRTYDGLIGIHGTTVREVAESMRGVRWERNAESAILNGDTNAE